MNYCNTLIRKFRRTLTLTLVSYAWPNINLAREFVFEVKKWSTLSIFCHERFIIKIKRQKLKRIQAFVKWSFRQEIYHFFLLVTALVVCFLILRTFESLLIKFIFIIFYGLLVYLRLFSHLIIIIHSFFIIYLYNWLFIYLHIYMH